MIAATAAVTALVRRETFRSRLRWSIARYGAISAQRAASLLRRVSATVVELAAGYTEARADTYAGKTNSNNSVGLATDGVVRVTSGGTQRATFQAAQFSIEQVTSMIWYVGAQTDPRHTLSAGGIVAHTPVAGGAIDDVGQFREYPITNAAVIAVGDFVLFASVAGAGNRVSAAGAGSTGLVIGYATVGGTGNAGGTVFARIKTEGAIMATILSGSGGTVDGQFGLPDNAVANRMDSVTAGAVGVFSRVLDGSADGVAGDFYITGLTR